MHLEDEGWLVYQVKGSTKFNKNVDIFGLFDIFAIRRSAEHTEMRFIQVKSNKKPKLDNFREFKELYPEFIVEIWINRDRKGFEIITI